MEPLVDLPCSMPPSPKRSWVATTQRHMPSKREWDGGMMQMGVRERHCRTCTCQSEGLLYLRLSASGLHACSTASGECCG